MYRTLLRQTERKPTIPQRNAEEIRAYVACPDLLEHIRQKTGQYRSETEETTYAVITREFFIADDI